MSYYGANGPGSYYRPSFIGGFRFFPPVIKGLLISNVGIWLFLGFFLRPFAIGGVPLGGDTGLLNFYLALWPLGTNFWPWQLFTYMFMHGGLGHLFFNMLALWMFGMELENLWGSKRFLIYYLLCGLGAAFANLFVAPLLGQAAPTIGASGAVFGVLIAFGMLFPDRPIYLYFLLPVRAKYFIAAYIGMELFYGVTGTSDGVAHLAHLGGAAVGLILMLAERHGFGVGTMWNRFRSEFRNPFETTTRSVPRGNRVYDAHFYDIKADSSNGREDESVDQEVVDAILEKIYTAGYQSLTEDEKRTLNEASKKIH